MKIVIDGQIIDTENIYSISSEILSGNISGSYKPEFYFEIESFNDKIIYVSIQQHNGIDFKHANTLPSSDDRNNYLNSIINSNKNKIEKMRQDIVNIWSNNQSNIPSFDIEKY